MKKHLTRRPLSMRKKRAITGYLFILPFLIGFFAFVAGPLITSLRMSFSSVSLDSASGFTLKYIGIGNYLKALTIDKDFNRLLWESVKSLLVDVPCIILFSLIIAVLLIVLGLTIVVNALKSYAKSKSGSEQANA